MEHPTRMLLLVLVCLYVDQVSSLTCLYCTGISQPRHCKQVLQCGYNQHCYAERYQDNFGEQKYNLGCTQSSVCPRPDVNVKGTCTECCTNNLCNSALCGEQDFPYPRGPICYNCPRYTATCHDIEFCNVGEECSISGTLEFSDEVISSGCRPFQTCGDSSPMIGRRDTELQERTIHQYTCSSCCKGDLCNYNCSGTTSTPAPMHSTPHTPMHSTSPILMHSTVTHHGLIDVGNYRDCYEIQSAGLSRGDGLYRIYPVGHQHVDVFCDMTTGGGGWTVFQYRYDGSVDFYRNFSEYENGFGQYPGEFWLGLKYLYLMTSTKNYQLRINVTASTGMKGYMKYQQFTLSRPDNYTIHTGGFSGNTGDKMKRQEGMAFTTFDHDRDAGTDFGGQNCAKSFHGAWWYSNCFDSNLNAEYHPGEDSSSNMCLNDWSGFSGYKGLSSSQMAIRPA